MPLSVGYPSAKDYRKKQSFALISGGWLKRLRRQMEPSSTYRGAKSPLWADSMNLVTSFTAAFTSRLWSISTGLCT